MPNEKLVLHIQDEILMIIVDQKQCRNSRSCSSSHVLPKIPPIHEKTPAQKSHFNTLLKKKSHRRWIPRESGKTSKNTPYIEHLQRQLSTILKTSNIFCSTNEQLLCKQIQSVTTHSFLYQLSKQSIFEIKSSIESKNSSLLFLNRTLRRQLITEYAKSVEQVQPRPNQD